MSIVVIILIIIGALIAILLIAAAALPKGYVIETDILIDKPVAEVYGFIKCLENQGQYNKWVMLDPNVKKEYHGTDGTVGFAYSWQSENKQLGKGEQVITGLEENKRVDYGLKFVEPFPNEANAYLVTDAVSAAQTKVTWGFSGKRTFMMKLMHFVLNLKKMLKKDLHESLQNLKALLEK